MAEEKKQKSTFLQFILFIIMSLVAFAVQMLIVTFGDDLLIKCGINGSDTFEAWKFGTYTTATFIAFLVGNIVAKVISYILNRKKTFGAVNNLVFSMVVYVIMCVTLIVVETLIGEPLGKALIEGLPDKFWELLKTTKDAERNNPDWSSTLAMIIYSIADFLIVFLMEKFVIMNDNLFKSSAKEEETETIKNEDNEVVADVNETEIEVAEEPAEEEQTVEEPMAEVEESQLEIEEETAEEVVEEVKEETVEENQVVEEPTMEEEPQPVEEEKVAEPVVEEPVEEVKEASKAEDKKEEGEKVMVKKVKEEKVKKMGTIEYRLGVDGYHFSIYANNGQLMFESQGFASLDTAKSGLETFKEALKDSPTSVYQDKRGLWRFIINKRYVGEGYKTRAQAENAIESVKKFTTLGTLIDYEKDPAREKEYNAAKKKLNKGDGVDWDKALAIPKKTSGKFEINGREDRGYYFSLLANNGQLMYCSRYYASEDTCEDAITTFKKAAYLNNFFVDVDKFGNYRFILKGTAAGIAYYGESYNTKSQAEDAAESVRKFAASAKIVPFEPDADDE